MVYKQDVSDTGGRIFPPRNGVITVLFQGETKERTLRYRQNDIEIDRLLGVHDPNGGSVAGKTMQDQPSYIRMTALVAVESLGTFGQGGQAVSRKVTYETPVGYVTLSAPKTEWKESFNSSLAKLVHRFGNEPHRHPGCRGRSHEAYR